MKLNKGLQASAVVSAALLLATACSSSKKAAPATSSAAAPAATSSAAAPAASTPAAATTSAPAPSSAAPAAGGGGLIGLDFPRSDTAFWASYISYVPKFATQLGANVKTTNSANNVQTLIANTQALLGQGAKAIVMAPQDTAA
ncbi:MAG TPA: hypothetical protein VIL94_09860, partial [Acidothermaceae bacterium]